MNDMREQVKEQEAALRIGDCRASAPAPAHLEGALRTRLADCFSSPHVSLPTEGSMAAVPADQQEVLNFVMRMGGTCILSNACKPFCEKEYLASIRVPVSGSRQVLMCRSNTLLACKPATAEDAAGLHTTYTKDMMRAKNLIANIAPSDVGKHTQEWHGELWYGTVGPMDMLYVPPGFMMLEMTAQDPCWGYRVGVYVHTAAGLNDVRKEIAKVLPTEMKRRQLFANYIAISEALEVVPLATAPAPPVTTEGPADSVATTEPVMPPAPPPAPTVTEEAAEAAPLTTTEAGVPPASPPTVAADSAAEAPEATVLPAPQASPPASVPPTEPAVAAADAPAIDAGEDID